MAARTPRETAWTFHQTLVEILRHLNQVAERSPGVDGLELFELERTMARYWSSQMPGGDLPEALRVLEENRMVVQDHAPVYAWDRQRTVGDRFRITADGKAYLLRQVEARDRIR